MKLISVNKPEPKKIIEENVKWVVAFAVVGVKPVIVEACTCVDDAGSGMIKFYKSGEKTPCAMFNMDQILSAFQRGCVSK